MWRAMSEGDLSAVFDVAEQVHVDFPEALDVFAERLRLYPQGCRVLVRDGAVCGYVLSHPWRLFDPPALDSLLGALPEKPDTYYVHDLALLPHRRGSGFAAAIVSELIGLAQKEKFRTLSLVAVNGSESFWRKFGWREAENEYLAAKLASYAGKPRYMVYDLEEQKQNQK